MRHAIAALTVVVCGALTACAADDEKFTSKEGKYAVRFPGGAETKAETSKVGQTNVESVKGRLNGGTFVAGYKDGPDQLKMVPPKDIFDTLMKMATDNGIWKVTSSTDSDFGVNKLPSRSMLIERKEGTWANTRFILSGNRVYLLSVNGSKDVVTSKEATAFLDSFELTK